MRPAELGRNWKHGSVCFARLWRKKKHPLFWSELEAYEYLPVIATDCTFTSFQWGPCSRGSWNCRALGKAEGPVSAWEGFWTRRSTGPCPQDTAHGFDGLKSDLKSESVADFPCRFCSVSWKRTVPWESETCLQRPVHCKQILELNLFWTNEYESASLFWSHQLLAQAFSIVRYFSDMHTLSGGRHSERHQLWNEVHQRGQDTKFRCMIIYNYIIYNITILYNRTIIYIYMYTVYIVLLIRLYAWRKPAVQDSAEWLWSEVELCDYRREERCWFVLFSIILL